MSGEALGRRLLELDAAYCAVGGSLAVVAVVPLAELIAAPRALLVVTGLGAIVWALLLHRLARRTDWRAPVAVVAAANLLAAGTIAALAIASAELAGRLLLAAVAVEVAAFAAGQLEALRRRPPASPGR